MHSIYRINKERAIYRDTSPTLTDQAGARETDINVIVARYGIAGQVPGTTQQPMYGDFSELPEDLRGFIETARSFEERRAELPEQLRNLTVDELMTLTPDELATKLTPPAQPPAQPPAPEAGKGDNK